MFVVMGATGHVGSACVDALIDAGEEVVAIVHDAGRAGPIREAGARIVEADATDADGLRRAFRMGRRAFLLNPPGDVRGDSDAAERRTVQAILDALDGSELDRVVAASTYGAQPGKAIGDLSVLYELEQGLKRQPIPAVIQRGAYYYSNFDAQCAAIRDEGVLRTMLPKDRAIPMVSPGDLGRNAARLLRDDDATPRTICVEGPERLSPTNVAAAFAGVLGRDVAVEVTPRGDWAAAFRELGFSEAAAESFARMIAVSVDEGFAAPDDVVRGGTTIGEHVRALVAENADEG